MKTIVFNTSPLIFLAQLGWLKDFILSQENDYYLPQAVAAVSILVKTNIFSLSSRILDRGKFNNDVTITKSAVVIPDSNLHNILI